MPLEDLQADLDGTRLSAGVEALLRKASDRIDLFLESREGPEVSPFLPSDFPLAYAGLDVIRRERWAIGDRFCEWGSGLGVVTGLAEIRGFRAHGIERDASLAEKSRALLADVGLGATIETGNYLASTLPADVYFVYCWPGTIAETEAHFAAIAPARSRLLICYGQSDIRCKTVGSRAPIQQRHGDVCDRPCRGIAGMES